MSRSSFPLEDAPHLASLLSHERLTPFVALTGALPSAISLHLDTLRLGCQLMAVTGIIEVALRNSICDRLDQHFNTVDWLQNPPHSFMWKASEKSKISAAYNQAKKAEYTKLSQSAKRQLDTQAYPQGVPANLPYAELIGTRRQLLTVSRGQVIAQLTLFFWKRLFSKEYDHLLWRPTLKSIFPNKSLRRPDIASHLEVIYQARNRVAHHEPIYGRRLHEVLEAIDFITNEFGETNGSGRRYLTWLLETDVSTLKEEAAALQARVQSYRG